MHAQGLGNARAKTVRLDQDGRQTADIVHAGAHTQVVQHLTPRPAHLQLEIGQRQLLRDDFGVIFHLLAHFAHGGVRAETAFHAYHQQVQGVRQAQEDLLLALAADPPQHDGRQVKPDAGPDDDHRDQRRQASHQRDEFQRGTDRMIGLGGGELPQRPSAARARQQHRRARERDAQQQFRLDGHVQRPSRFAARVVHYIGTNARSVNGGVSDNRRLRGALLTRRAKALSGRHAVVVRFNKRRGRYERQGLLVEPQALAQAQRELNAEDGGRTTNDGWCWRICPPAEWARCTRSRFTSGISARSR